MVMIYQTVGNTVVQWEEHSPLVWSMQEKIKADDDEVRTSSIDLDLRPLEVGYEMAFLLALKDTVISRRHRISLRTIWAECWNLNSLLQTCHKNGIVNGKVKQIDSAFLLGLETCSASIPATYLQTFKRLFEFNRTNAKLFDGTLYPEDFPLKTSGKGQTGERISRILSKVLTRAAMVSVLDTVDEAYETGRIDLGVYSFSKLAFNIFCRPESYRQIRVKDLVLDTNEETGEVAYFLHVLPAKSRVEGAQRIVYRLHRDVGLTLALQRQSVVERFGHIVENKEEDLGKLALFPSQKLKPDGTWFSAHARTNFGMLVGSSSFSPVYMKPLNKAVGRVMSFR
jgi:integrase